MAKVTISKQFGNASMMSAIPNYLAEVAKDQMVKMVEKTVDATVKKDWLPFNLKVYVQQGGAFDLMDKDFVKLGLKVDAVYMGSSWGLLKIVAKDLLSQKKEQLKYKWHNLMLKLKLVKEKDWE
jgi:hypothetical protein